MLSLDEVVKTVADKLAAPPPVPDGDGDCLFELSDDMRLGIREKGDGGFVAWAGVAAAATGETAAETAAAAFLRIRLARLRRHGRVVATRNERGDLLLYLSLRPENGGELLERLAELLNETEAVRRVMAGDTAPAAGGTSLFAGMSAFFGRP